MRAKEFHPPLDDSNKKHKNRALKNRDRVFDIHVIRLKLPSGEINIKLFNPTTNLNLKL